MKRFLILLSLSLISSALFAGEKPKKAAAEPREEKDDSALTVVLALDANFVSLGITDRASREKIRLRNSDINPNLFTPSFGAMGPLDMISESIGFRIVGESYRGHLSQYGSGYSTSGYGEIDSRFTYAAPAFYFAPPDRNDSGMRWVLGAAAGIGYVSLEGKFRTTGDYDSAVYLLNRDKSLSEQARARRDYLIASGALKSQKDNPALQYMLLRMQQADNLEVLGQYMVARGSALPDRIGLDYISLPAGQQPSLAQYIALTQTPGAKRIRFSTIAPAAFLFLEVRVPYGLVYWSVGGPFFTREKVQYDFLQNFRFGYRIRIFDSSWVGR